jgi:molybdate transport system substrate-binding protein
MANTGISGISSMATRAVLSELAAAFEQHSGTPVVIESVGGVDAAKRVQAGEPFDVVVLASDAIDKLIAAGRITTGSKVDLVRSGVAVAVRAGAPKPDIGSEEALKRAVLAAHGIGYSTGPSGVALARLFERWGIAAQIADRIVEARPGVPVGSLVARGEVEIGFQQLSELMNLDGVAVLGMLPSPIQVVTTFSGGICAESPNAEGAYSLLAFMAGAQCDAAKRRHGMEPARTHQGQNT